MNFTGTSGRLYKFKFPAFLGNEVIHKCDDFIYLIVLFFLNQ